MADEAEAKDQEIAVTGPGGLGARAKGYRLMDLAWIVLGAAVTWQAWHMQVHAGDSNSQNAAIVKSITEANSAIVQALKEQQAVAKESNAQTVRVLERLTAAQREGNCLLDPLMKNRNDAREFCKRMSRDER